MSNKGAKTIVIMNVKPQITKIIKRLEILCYLASAICIIGAIAPYREVLSIALGAIAIYLVAHGICLKMLRRSISKPEKEGK